MLAVGIGGLVLAVGIGGLVLAVGMGDLLLGVAVVGTVNGKSLGLIQPLLHKSLSQHCIKQTSPVQTINSVF